MHPLVASCVCPDEGLSLQPWRIGAMIPARADSISCFSSQFLSVADRYTFLNSHLSCYAHSLKQSVRPLAVICIVLSI